MFGRGFGTESRSSRRSGQRAVEASTLGRDPEGAVRGDDELAGAGPSRPRSSAAPLLPQSYGVRPLESTRAKKPAPCGPRMSHRCRLAAGPAASAMAGRRSPAGPASRRWPPSQMWPLSLTRGMATCPHSFGRGDGCDLAYDRHVSPSDDRRRCRSRPTMTPRWCHPGAPRPGGWTGPPVPGTGSTHRHRTRQGRPRLAPPTACHHADLVVVTGHRTDGQVRSRCDRPPDGWSRTRGTTRRCHPARWRGRPVGSAPSPPRERQLPGPSLSTRSTPGSASSATNPEGRAQGDGDGATVESEWRRRGTLPSRQEQGTESHHDDRHDGDEPGRIDHRSGRPRGSRADMPADRLEGHRRRGGDPRPVDGVGGRAGAEAALEGGVVHHRSAPSTSLPRSVRWAAVAYERAAPGSMPMTCPISSNDRSAW